MVFVRFQILLMLLSMYTLSIQPPSTPPSAPPCGPRHLALSAPPPPNPCPAPSVWPHPPPLWRPPFGSIRAPFVWPRQPYRRAPSAPSVRPRLLLSTNNYKFFQVFVSQCFSCVRSLKSVASLDVVPCMRPISQGPSAKDLNQSPNHCSVS
jgi:hypothetical protein